MLPYMKHSFQQEMTFFSAHYSHTLTNTDKQGTLYMQSVNKRSLTVVHRQRRFVLQC